LRARLFSLFFIVIFLFIKSTAGQSPDGTVSGLVLDPDGAVIVGADVLVVNEYTGVQYSAKTSSIGIYLVGGLAPGKYRIQVSNGGFKTIIKPDVTVHVQDALAINFTLPVGDAAEIVTVEAGAPVVNTENASVSTVVDRQFAENLPLNGRSFQTLFQLTPGVVVTTSSPYDGGQFSVNGQRASSNYWTVDGVGANVAASASGIPGNSLSGALATTSALGGTNSLVSVDALQEFRIQTSTYAPEFGRTPGAQISVVTRSGTNDLHGTLFDYLRNDVFDANDWFADSEGLPKPKEHQNDFGGTFSGPVLKDRTFFFFSYEGLRLRLPEVGLTTVPDLAARQAAVPAMQAFLNAFPLPNATDLGDGIAEFNSSYSNPASLNAYSLRLDQKIGEKLNLFGRYNYSPSEIRTRGAAASPLSNVTESKITVQTATIGATWLLSSGAGNDFRFNYSSTNALSRAYLDDFGGATPIAAPPFPAPFSIADSLFSLSIDSLPASNLELGKFQRNLQRQVNIVDSLSWVKGRHTFKVGVDFRRLTPRYGQRLYQQYADFSDVPSFETGALEFGLVLSYANTTFLFNNLGSFVQDTWHATSRLTLTYGLRWDIDFVPGTLSGPNIPAVTGFNLTNLSNLALAPAGTPPYATTYGNVAPRLGVAYQISPDQRWGVVVRGGLGLFYDLASSETGAMVFNGAYPFSARNVFLGGSFPFDSASAAPPAITPANLSAGGTLVAFDPNLKLPRTLQWNVALEQALGTQQAVSITYAGAAGQRLLQTATIFAPTPDIGTAWLVTNAATSNYNSLQVQFHRRLTDGLQALMSYTLAHSIDTASAGSIANAANALDPTVEANANRGPSDFDIRNAFSAGITYDLPVHHLPRVASGIVNGWSLQSVVQARSAPPVEVQSLFFDQLNGGIADVRPDIVPNEPFYLYGQIYPGGRALNPAAFTNPPIDPNTGEPLRQGNLGRNALRSFGAVQWDFAVHRNFRIHDSLVLEFRAELFNVLNHPNFGPPYPFYDYQAVPGNPIQFGRSYQMLNQSLNAGNLGGGAFDPLYQIGGPRSVQFALKLHF
jgi:Carboxypeptidase regulatory-like domain/TonB dependent receptor